jgi:tRNA threonylcarbamoyladenosine biosynthesis protein TsaE
VPRAGSVPGEAATFDRLAPGPADTARLGRLFGLSSPDGAVILLEGGLGAGKTTFAQGVAEGCGVPGPVSSPTYNLVLHHAGRRPFVHADLYRLADPGELETLDLDEIFSPPGLAVVEWPELVADRATPPCAVVVLVREGGGRRIAGRLIGAGWSAVREALEAGP